MEQTKLEYLLNRKVTLQVYGALKLVGTLIKMRDHYLVINELGDTALFIPNSLKRVIDDVVTVDKLGMP